MMRIVHSEKINQYHEKEPTMNFKTFERILIHSNIDLREVFFKNERVFYPFFLFLEII